MAGLGEGWDIIGVQSRIKLWFERSRYRTRSCSFCSNCSMDSCDQNEEIANSSMRLRSVIMVSNEAEDKS